VDKPAVAFLIDANPGEPNFERQPENLPSFGMRTGNVCSEASGVYPRLSSCFNFLFFDGVMLAAVARADRDWLAVLLPHLVEAQHQVFLYWTLLAAVAASHLDGSEILDVTPE
jgi:hypothetical protein